jgi:hypothetical protein
MSHAIHAVLTLLTCGLWLPIWVICAIVGTVPTNCTLCGNVLKRTHYIWTIDGHEERVCTHCNQQLERRQSRRRFSR